MLLPSQNPNATESAQGTEVRVQAVPVSQAALEQHLAPGSWPGPPGRSVPLQLKILL